LGAETLPRAESIAFNDRVLWFAVLLALLTPLLFGVLPAFRSASGTDAGTLKDSPRTATADRRSSRLLGMLAAAQIALAVVLSVGAGLLLRSFLHLLSMDPGFRSEKSVRLTVTPRSGGYPELRQVRSFYDRAIEAAHTIPGVLAFGIGSDLPLGVRERRTLTAEGPARPIPGLGRMIAVTWASPGYFEALIPLKRGRVFIAAEGPERPAVIVNGTTPAKADYWEVIGTIKNVYTSRGPDPNSPLLGKHWFAYLTTDGICDLSTPGAGLTSLVVDDPFTFPRIEFAEATASRASFSREGEGHLIPTYFDRFSETSVDIGCCYIGTFPLPIDFVFDSGGGALTGTYEVLSSPEVSSVALLLSVLGVTGHFAGENSRLKLILKNAGYFICLANNHVEPGAQYQSQTNQPMLATFPRTFTPRLAVGTTNSCDFGAEESSAKIRHRFPLVSGGRKNPRARPPGCTRGS
jgi:hypothetical protein